MRIAVLGAGGVGGYFGGRLAAAGSDVTFVARGAHLEALRSRGLTVHSFRGDFYVPRVNAADDPRAFRHLRIAAVLRACPKLVGIWAGTPPALCCAFTPA